MRPMTIAIPSYQRRDSLARLLDSLASEIERHPHDTANLEVAVVLDGSTDGSQQMLETREFPVELRHIWQPNRGMAAARNAGLHAAKGEVIWFLDDDMVVDDGTLARHRQAHEQRDEHVLTGPCWFPEDWVVVAPVRDWSHTMYEHFEQAGELTSAVYFSPANTSSPVHLLTDIGGFDETFEFWGGEDMELGIRLLRAGVPVRYDAAASVRHLQADGIRDVCRKKYTEARCAVRLVARYPETFPDLFPTHSPPAARMLRWLPRWPGVVRTAARLAALIAERADRPRDGEPGRGMTFRFAVRLSRIAGILAEDRDGSLRRRLAAAKG